ncbi:Tubulin-tyrosine ligase family protein [Cardiosporidium cionae]|uniref:Tubulin-tyrosine ligase family protein n=1 Tax=Cardiosporidium cionae TaxID=476202 RepID=A0ABQ7JER4_9APIC|nr:Tubulin-tyrosine ligase family protein [Cardiosporidium cionae]|eukprot:KAF8822500.1 Tubulin-tyrosine ligase family protein [Cardiosporidium cionae]
MAICIHFLSYRIGGITWLGGAIGDNGFDSFPENNLVVNRFPSMHGFVTKHYFFKLLKAHKKVFPEDFSFFPDTWLLPEETKEFEKSRCSLTQAETIYNQGRAKISSISISKKHFFCNSNICTDLGSSPIKTFICRRGMVRICAEKYDIPTERNVANHFIHLTNYAVNKAHPKYVHSANLHDKNGNKRLLDDILEELTTQGVDKNYVWEQIKRIANGVLTVLLPLLKLHYSFFDKKSIEKSIKCFQIIGLDILLDRNHRAWLLEVNANPSLRAGICFAML